MTISNCDEERLRISSKASEQFTEGRRLLKEKEYAKALECYLFAFDNSRYVDGWGGVRLSYIPAEIAQIGAHYPPALDALRARRDVRESLILEGETDFEVLIEWGSLNRYLGEKTREFDVLKKLEESGTLQSSVKEHILHSNFDYLLETGQFELLSGELRRQGSSFLHFIVEYETTLWFPQRRSRPEGVDWLEMERDSILRTGIPVFHLALGLGKESVADEVMKRILQYCNNANSYERLIRAAVATKNMAKARSILVQGKESISSEQYRVLGTLVNDVGESSST